MPSFNSLYSVRSGLFAQRRALETIGQNVANASTTGYTRQEVSFAAAEPGHVINSSGRGINDVNVIRYRDEFLDRQYRARTGAGGYHSARHAQLEQMEAILGDLNEGGLRTALDDFFNSWENLSLRPTDAGLRTLAVSSAQEFLDQARIAFDGLAQQRTSIDEAVRNKVEEINNAARQVAELNKAIVTDEATQQQANDLRDRRDMLLDSLAKLAGVTTSWHTDGTVSVHLGGLPLVDKEFAYPVSTNLAQEADMDPSAALTSIQQFVTTLTWNGTATAASFAKGEVGALVEMRDQTVPEFMKYLDNLVRTVATEVNARHTAGVVAPLVPQDIFVIQSEWMAIQVHPDVKANPMTIMPGMSNVPGDGERARSIAAIRSAAILTGNPVGSNTVTPGEFIRTISTVAGLQVQQAGRRSEASALQVEQSERQRQAVSGVSIDEEMTKMIQYQQAYNAAARTMTAIDEMLDVVVNRLGLVGR